jgi:Ribbon-helix-helix protein, copG family
MVRCMHRTNIYLTEAQERALDARARATGTTRSGALRAVLDEALATGLSPGDDEVAKALAGLGERFDVVAAALFADDPDLRID